MHYHPPFLSPVWGKSVAAAEERARNAQDSGGNDGEYEYR